MCDLFLIAFSELTSLTLQLQTLPEMDCTCTCAHKEPPHNQQCEVWQVWRAAVLTALNQLSDMHIASTFAYKLYSHILIRL